MLLKIALKFKLAWDAWNRETYIWFSKACRCMTICVVKIWKFFNGEDSCHIYFPHWNPPVHHQALAQHLVPWNLTTSVHIGLAFYVILHSLCVFPSTNPKPKMGHCLSSWQHWSKPALCFHNYGLAQTNNDEDSRFFLVLTDASPVKWTLFAVEANDININLNVTVKVAMNIICIAALCMNKYFISKPQIKICRC